MSTRRKRSKPRVAKVEIIPVINLRYEPKNRNETALSDMGYNPLDFKLLNKTIDNLSFVQISTGKVLDLRI